MSEQYISKQALEKFVIDELANCKRTVYDPTEPPDEYSCGRFDAATLLGEKLKSGEFDTLSAPQVVGGELLDYAVLTMLRELHSNVPADKQPVGMCDLSDDQAKRAKAAVRAVITALSASPVAGWMPIETADALPKDGNHFLVIDLLNRGIPTVVVYFDSDFMECNNGTWVEIESYTHYFVPPPQPTTAEEGQK